MKALLFFLLAITLPVAAQDDIPSRSLAEVGCGPVLLIGVKDYAKDTAFAPLPGIEKDLTAMEATVRALGFTDVTVLTDPDRRAMETAMNTFGGKIKSSAKASFFYYSGHGVLQEKLNYLIPARAPIVTRGHLETYALPAEHVLGFVTENTSGPCLFFIDACRSNDLPADSKASGDGSLLLKRKGGVFIGFATAAGKTSQAAPEGSPYTASLAKRLLTPGYSLDDLYAGVIHDVEKATADSAETFQPPTKVSELRYRLILQPAGDAGSLPGSPTKSKMEWKILKIGDRAFVTIDQVATYYHLEKPVIDNDVVRLKNKYFKCEFKIGGNEIKLNGWCFFMSFNSLRNSGVPMVSAWDVRNVLDPLLRPNDRRAPALLRSVVIDPFGGGSEVGIDSSYATEKALTLDVAMQLAEHCKAAGYEVILTRGADVAVSADDRKKKLAAAAGESIYISLRANHSDTDSRKFGFQCATIPPPNPTEFKDLENGPDDKAFYPGNIMDRESLALASVMRSSAVNALKTRDLGVYRHPFPELRDITIPGIVCQCGYLSNPTEGQKLGALEYRQSIARALADGVKHYAGFLNDRSGEIVAQNNKTILKFGAINDTGIGGMDKANSTAVLDIPVIASGTKPVDHAKTSLQISIFELGESGEILLSSLTPSIKWNSESPDWNKSLTEFVRATYSWPPKLSARKEDGRLRRYFGYTARLIYDGRLVDESSSPQYLHRWLFYFTKVSPPRE